VGREESGIDSNRANTHLTNVASHILTGIMSNITTTPFVLDSTPSFLEICPEPRILVTTTTTITTNELSEEECFFELVFPNHGAVIVGGP
jgi:hypothetical protein